jgi:hypothetical protein
MSFDSKEPFIAPESHPLRRRTTNTLGFVFEENEPMRRHVSIFTYFSDLQGSVLISWDLF